jgi:molybdopterin-guanine dinucleotide biosynthesis protein A
MIASAGERMIAGAILAGGSARRLGGVAKGLEPVGGVRMVDRVVAALRPLTSEIVLVGAPATVAATVRGVVPIADDEAGAGPLGGIISALRATQRDTLVVAWDMPFVSVDELRPLLDAPDNTEMSAPVCDDQLEPLCALYRLSALASLECTFAKGERSAVAALRLLRVHRVAYPNADGSLSSFSSVNTPEQLAAARAGNRLLFNRPVPS